MNFFIAHPSCVGINSPKQVYCCYCC